ncbi:F-box domain-containing protein [Colletotrichum scovillei]|uniref:F-box domain-containing protein n=1 Tax=Colletotrichum scovillei TaxID=1209932 RepID=A0A9P7RD11_9PEZI|nr:F-box domain-containing protein [Colletotrichum scovillei]KAG7081820.1 F-box domain-containing protein [Colletotrichum scovillei]
MAAVDFARMQRLPIEIMTYIANSLNLHDIFNLSLVCQQFKYLVDNNDICRAALETHAPYSADFLATRSSKQYARCLRRLVKLRDAIATAKPYTTALVAHAVDFIYCNGMLCYTESYEVLRLLNLHASSDSEDIIDTRMLLQNVPGANLTNNKYKFRPIHFAHGVLSCLYSPPKTEGRSRLVVINVEKRALLTAQRLDSTSKLFVRNNQDYLYYGTHSVTGDDGFKRWVLRRFDLRTKQWIPGHLDLEDLAGSDIGATVCFEIIDGYFYGLSSLNSFEVYETDSLSYYYGFRLPVGSTQPGDMQLASKESMLRRDHKDGPIDDRWSTLQLAKDLVTGNIMVSECRREWLVNESSSARTAYRKELVFAAPPVDPGDRDTEADTHQNAYISTPRCSSTKLVSLEKKEDTTYAHRGDDGSTLPTITLSHCFIRSYNQACGSFVDLVNDPVATEAMTQRPQIRSISRFPQSGIGRVPKESPADNSAQVSHQTHWPNEISSWPPEVDVSQRNVHLDALDNILCPKGQSTFGNISGVMDERSLVYAIGQRGSQTRRPLVFICFDPSIKLTGLARWPGGPTRPPCNHKTTECDNARDPEPYPTPQSLPVSAPGSRNASFSEGSIPDPSQTSANVQTGISRPDAPSWMKRASAAYLQTISALGNPVGFNFAFCKDHSVPCRCC